MKLLCGLPCLLISLSAVLALSDDSQLFEYQEGDRYFMTNDEFGNLRLVDLEITDLNYDFVPERDLGFILYTISNPTDYQVIVYGNESSLNASNYDFSKDTKISIHGWTGTPYEKACNWVRDAYLENMDVNLVCLDWSVSAAALYPTSVSHVPSIGQFLGKFIDWLIQLGATIEQFHIIGHSLGGHIAGAAGRSVSSGKVPYISALDPAGPLWGNNSERIRASDALYVEVIHTNVGTLGLTDAVGHADFYPNSGNHMPGCLNADFSCSHGRSVAYFANSIDNTFFIADQCANLDEILSDNCSNITQSYMGGASPKNAHGLYLLKTGPKPPYYIVDSN